MKCIQDESLGDMSAPRFAHLGHLRPLLCFGFFALARPGPGPLEGKIVPRRERKKDCGRAASQSVAGVRDMYFCGCVDDWYQGSKVYGVYSIHYVLGQQTEAD